MDTCKKNRALVHSAVNYDLAESSKTGLHLTLWSALVAAGRFFGRRTLTGLAGPARARGPMYFGWADPLVAWWGSFFVKFPGGGP